MNWKFALRNMIVAMAVSVATCAAQSDRPPAPQAPAAQPSAEIQKFTDMLNAAGGMLTVLKNQHDRSVAERAADPNAAPRPLRDPKTSVILVTGGAASGAAIGAAITKDARGAVLGAVAGAMAGVIYDRMTYRSPGSN